MMAVATFGSDDQPATLPLQPAEAFAKLVRVQSGRTVRRWESDGDDRRDIPGPVEVLATALRDSATVRKYFGVEIKD